jgi:hypothetical protein
VFITEHGKILSRRTTNLTVKQQKQLKQSRVKSLIHARKEKGIDYVSGIGVPDLESFAHNDFQWDCIIYVDGHSDIDERVADLKNYSDRLWRAAVLGESV